MASATASITKTTPANPYISRGPLRALNMFYGREHDLHEIAAFLNGNQSIALVGPRKIGKTSLLFHLMRPETRETFGLGDNTVIAYLDCEMLGESSVEEIFGQFATEIAAVLVDMGLPPEPALDTVIAAPKRLAFESAIRRLNQRGLRIVLVLDEFERISTNTALDLNFFNALRSAAGRYQLMFITASASPLIDLTYSGRSREILSSPFFNIFAPMFLGLLDEKDARRLISEPAERAGSPFAPDMQDFLYQLAGGHALALQVVCFHAFNTMFFQRMIQVNFFSGHTLAFYKGFAIFCFTNLKYFVNGLLCIFGPDYFATPFGKINFKCFQLLVQRFNGPPFNILSLLLCQVNICKLFLAFGHSGIVFPNIKIDLSPVLNVGSFNGTFSNKGL